MVDKPKIKVAFTIPNFDTAGSGKALLKVATGLDPDRFEPSIWCNHDRGAFFQEVKASGIPVVLMEHNVAMKPYHQGLKACWKLSKAFKKLGPDIIHSFHYAPDYSEALAARIAGIPWVYTKKNMNWGGKSANGWRLRTLLSRGIAYQNTDMKKQFFPKSKKAFCIPRGVDTEEFRPTSPDLELKRSLGLEPDANVVMCVANLVPVKGIEILLHAWEELFARTSKWTLMVVGDDRNPYGEKLHKQVGSMQSRERILFTGKRPDVAALLQIAQIVVLPTLNQGRMEGSPLAILEGMATAKYVLGSNIPGIRDQLASYPDLLVPSGDTDQWTNAIAKAIGLSQAEREEIGRSLREEALHNFRIEAEVQRTQKMYLTVLNKNE